MLFRAPAEGDGARSEHHRKMEAAEILGQVVAEYGHSHIGQGRRVMRDLFADLMRRADVQVLPVTHPAWFAFAGLGNEVFDNPVEGQTRQSSSSFTSSGLGASTGTAAWDSRHNRSASIILSIMAMAPLRSRSVRLNAIIYSG